MRLPEPPILVVTDRAQCPEPIEGRALALFQGGCRWLSLREKDLEAPARRALLEKLVAIGRDFGATIGVHDDCEAARSCGAALHLSAGGDPRQARRALGSSVLIGQSCHSAADLAAAAEGGANYATLGPVATTASKPGYRPALPPRELGALAARAGLPVLALGGVTTENAARLVGWGFAGVAVMGEAMRTPVAQTWFGGLAEAIRKTCQDEG
ncbi:MAG TPA: thiamine phosphate synthase [Alphaproteobacteria bacterium]|nr:thiamine phosphate synthase [Alphaproteobacteria bacterium]